MQLSRFTAHPPPPKPTIQRPARGKRLARLFGALAIGAAVLVTGSAKAKAYVNNKTSHTITVKYTGTLQLANGQNKFVSTSWAIAPKTNTEVKYSGLSINNRSMKLNVSTKWGEKNIPRTRTADRFGNIRYDVYESHIKAPARQAQLRNTTKQTLKITNVSYYDVNGYLRVVNGSYTLKPLETIKIADHNKKDIFARSLMYTIDWNGGRTAWTTTVTSANAKLLTASIDQDNISPPRGWTGSVAPGRVTADRWFATSIGTRQMTFTLENVNRNGSVTLYIYDSNNKLVGSSTAWGVANKTVTVDVSKPGKYRVRVRSASTTATTNFKVGISESTQPIAQQENAWR